MSKAASQEKVTILDKEYMIACGPDEREALQESARILDKKMREIRTSGKIIGTERIAVMAALNLAYELLSMRKGEQAQDSSLNLRMRLLQEKIDAVLEAEDKQLSL